MPRVLAGAGVISFCSRSSSLLLPHPRKSHQQPHRIRMCTVLSELYFALGRKEEMEHLPCRLLSKGGWLPERHRNFKGAFFAV